MYHLTNFHKYSSCQSASISNTLKLSCKKGCEIDFFIKKNNAFVIRCIKLCECINGSVLLFGSFPYLCDFVGDVVLQELGEDGLSVCDQIMEALREALEELARHPDQVSLTQSPKTCFIIDKFVVQDLQENSLKICDQDMVAL